MDGNLEVRRIDLWSLFKLSFIIYAFLGLLMGLFYALFIGFIGSINSALFAEGLPNMGLVGPLVGLVAIPFMALIQGVFGSVVTTVCGWVYNLVAGAAGGIRIHAVGEAAERPAASAYPGGGTGDGSKEEQPPDRTPPTEAV